MICATGEAFALKCRMRAGCYHRFLKLDFGTGGNPGVINNYLFIQVVLYLRKNRDEFINYTVRVIASACLLKSMNQINL